MNEFDKASRYAAKQLDVPGFFRYFLGEQFARAWRWLRWEDSQSDPFPSEGDLRVDLVAVFERVAGDALPLIVIVEFLTEARAAVLERLAAYAMRYRLGLVYQREPLVRYDVIAVVVNLTGQVESDEWSMAPSDCDGLSLRLKAGVRNLREKDATAVLTAIEAGQIAPAILPWVALMAGGDRKETVVRWRRLAEREGDDLKRATYGALALLFAEAAGRKKLWSQELEGYDVRRAEITLEWEAVGRAEGKVSEAQENLVRVLEVRFPGQVTVDLIQAIRNQPELATLHAWRDRSLTVVSVEEFRQGLETTTGGV